ncbi:hypothetical protein ElyMa_006957800 [Elysia marginata]|uniref:Uncharacterized protein n=1 Tax=Elysia marginata TaxID=1093978 RepID=A0AAV4JMS9_9GAST|nr:hypothetical protein ElyMa_006957800 [Elysia marginata]
MRALSRCAWLKLSGKRHYVDVEEPSILSRQRKAPARIPTKDALSSPAPHPPHEQIQCRVSTFKQLVSLWQLSQNGSIMKTLWCTGTCTYEKTPSFILVL